jgi:hypothetical protein
MSAKKRATEEEAVTTCLCYKTRMAARAVTRAYDRALRSTFTIELGRPLDGHQRHSEGLGHVSLRRAALHDELTGEKPEAGQIALSMGKDRKWPLK